LTFSGARPAWYFILYPAVGVEKLEVEVKSMKYNLAILLAVIIMLGFAGCVNRNDNPTYAPQPAITAEELG